MKNVLSIARGEIVDQEAGLFTDFPPLFVVFSWISKERHLQDKSLNYLVISVFVVFSGISGRFSGSFSGRQLHARKKSVLSIAQLSIGEQV